MKKLLSAHVLLLLLILLSPRGWAQSGCVTCHADEASLKRLFAPPKAAASEGEG